MLFKGHKLQAIGDTPRERNHDTDGDGVFDHLRDHRRRHVFGKRAPCFALLAFFPRVVGIGQHYIQDEDQTDWKYRIEQRQLLGKQGP